MKKASAVDAKVGLILGAVFGLLVVSRFHEQGNIALTLAGALVAFSVYVLIFVSLSGSARFLAKGVYYFAMLMIFFHGYDLVFFASIMVMFVFVSAYVVANVGLLSVYIFSLVTSENLPISYVWIIAFIISFGFLLLMTVIRSNVLKKSGEVALFIFFCANLIACVLEVIVYIAFHSESTIGLWEYAFPFITFNGGHVS